MKKDKLRELLEERERTITSRETKGLKGTLKASEGTNKKGKGKDGNIAN